MERPMLTYLWSLLQWFSLFWMQYASFTSLVRLTNRLGIARTIAWLVSRLCRWTVVAVGSGPSICRRCHWRISMCYAKISFNVRFQILKYLFCSNHTRNWAYIVKDEHKIILISGISILFYYMCPPVLRADTVQFVQLLYLLCGVKFLTVLCTMRE